MGVDDCLLGAVLAFVIATVATPAGVSGAVLLLPVQVSVLHVANPALTPTNLLYNVLATPGALLRFAREGRLTSSLTSRLLIGTVPGVVVGAVLRVEVFTGPQAFLLAVAVVLGPLGAWLAVGARPTDSTIEPVLTAHLSLIGFVAGVIGGVYGIGGGSLLGPVLVFVGFSVSAVAPAALTSTFVTSIVGVLAFQALQAVKGDGAIAPEWLLGLSMGVGGISGSYLGARLQPRIPETALRRLLGVLCLALAVRYAVQGAGTT